MTNVVRPRANLLSASLITASVGESNAEVGSSRISTLGFFEIARASESRCR
jgi:hypothetical protein